MHSAAGHPTHPDTPRDLSSSLIAGTTSCMSPIDGVVRLRHHRRLGVGVDRQDRLRRSRSRPSAGWRRRSRTGCTGPGEIRLPVWPTCSWCGRQPRLVTTRETPTAPPSSSASSATGPKPVGAAGAAAGADDDPGRLQEPEWSASWLPVARPGPRRSASATSSVTATQAARRRAVRRRPARTAWPATVNTARPLVELHLLQRRAADDLAGHHERRQAVERDHVGGHRHVRAGRPRAPAPRCPAGVPAASDHDGAGRLADRLHAPPPRRRRRTTRTRRPSAWWTSRDAVLAELGRAARRGRPSPTTTASMAMPPPRPTAPGERQRLPRDLDAAPSRRVSTRTRIIASTPSFSNRSTTAGAASGPSPSTCTWLGGAGGGSVSRTRPGPGGLALAAHASRSRPSWPSSGPGRSGSAARRRPPAP